MAAMFLIGMSDLAWMIMLTAVVLADKIAPAPMLSRRLALSVAMVAFGVLYIVGA
jgi:predicted metal-binding membrane protein